MARVCHSSAACQRHTPSSLAAVIGLSNNDVISLRSLRCVRYVRCVGWKPHAMRHPVYYWTIIVTICTYVLLCTYGLCYFAFTDCVIIIVVALFARHCYSAIRLSS